MYVLVKINNKIKMPKFFLRHFFVLRRPLASRVIQKKAKANYEKRTLFVEK